MSLYIVYISQPNKVYRKDEALPGNTQLFSRKGTPRYPYFSGVFTLEAAVILPLLASFFVSILFFFRVMQIEITVQKALNDTGRQLAIYTANEESALSVAAAQTLFWNELEELEVPEKYIMGRKYGISLLSSSFSDREVDLKACYQIELPIRIFWIRNFSIEQRADCRKWNGWKASAADGEDDIWVYIAETGTVYHRKRDCTHLQLSIQSVNESQLPYLRNESGGRYHRCTSCVSGENVWGNVYITNQGDCYHEDLNCSGIRRTVYMVRLSEVENRQCCRRCQTYGEAQ